MWNGPLGAFEVPPFDKGTNAVAREAAKLTKAGQADERRRRRRHRRGAGTRRRRGDFSYVSTAGGAFLEWLEGKTLPGVAVLRK